MITIIIPVYKSEKTLKRCIDSLVKQTYSDIEIIMVVDGPPDRSGMLADKLAQKDSRIRVLHQKNMGVSAARNAGLDKARGEYIQFVDSDDYLEEDACEKLKQAVDKYHADIIFCGYHHHYFDRDIIKSPSMCGHFIWKEARELFGALYKEQFLNMPWNKLYRKDKIRAYFRRDLNLGEDLLFNLSYLENAVSVQVIPDALYHYIQDDRGTTLSTKKREDRIENAWILYNAICAFGKKCFEKSETEGIAAQRLVVTFLDEIENLYWDKERSRGEKYAVLKKYRQGLKRLSEHKISLPQIDYRIIYFFWSKRLYAITMQLINLRGFILEHLGLRGKGRPKEETMLEIDESVCLDESALVSIIIPVYGVEQYIVRAVESVCAQTYRNLEILLIDDGSKDASGEICEELSRGDKRIKVFHKENGGLSDARNYGLQRAKGEYIAFLDGDDFYTKEFVALLYNACRTQEVDIACCDFEETSKDTISGRQYESNTEEIQIQSFSKEEALWHMYEQNDASYLKFIVAWNKLYKRELWNGISFPKGRIHEDEATIYRIIDRADKLVAIKRVCYGYFQNKASITREKFKIKRLDILIALRERADYFAQKGNTKQEIFAKRALADASIRYTYQLAKSDEEKTPQGKRAKKEMRANIKYVLKTTRGTKEISLRNHLGYQIFLISPTLYQKLL